MADTKGWGRRREGRGGEGQKERAFERKSRHLSLKSNERKKRVKLIQVVREFSKNPEAVCKIKKI